jgi:ABC-type transport system substrate-binding protein
LHGLAGGVRPCPTSLDPNRGRSDRRSDLGRRPGFEYAGVQHPHPDGFRHDSRRAQPRSGGTLRLGMPIDHSSLEPHILTTGHFDTIWHVWDRLIQYNAQLEPQPMLAESWDVSSDQKQLKFNLRKGVAWHSGREFTSDDVKWNLLRVRDPRVAASQLAGVSNFYDSFETPDKNTIIFRSDTPRQASTTFDYLEFFDMVATQ